MSQKNLYRPCLKCDRPGIEKAIEVLPDRGTLIKVTHDDGSVCDFEEYTSIYSFLNRRKNKERNPTMMDFPLCGQEGRIGNSRPKKDKQFHKWIYFIVHEQIEGYWGKNVKSKNEGDAT